MMFHTGEIENSSFDLKPHRTKNITQPLDIKSVVTIVDVTNISKTSTAVKTRIPT